MTHPHITIIGNLIADPELKYVGSGTPVANFTVASTPRNYNKQTDTWEDGETTFFNCAVWRDYAENVAESLTKGARVVVYGKFKTRNYQRTDGSQGVSIELDVDEVGPSLRYATAQITKAGQAASARQNNTWGGVQTNAPAGGAPNDPWATSPTGNSFDDNPPF